MLHTVERTPKKEALPATLRRLLPEEVCRALAAVEGSFEEIHLRVGRACAVTVGGENRTLPLQIDRADMDALVRGLCGGALYAFRECINQGYLPLAGGVRVGLCGRASIERGEGGEEILGVRDIDALCIRLPHAARAVGQGILPALRSAFPAGTLIYSPPGVGKTTLLRALALELATGERAMRVALVDRRCELMDEELRGAKAHLSVLSGYPAGRGVEIAARSLNAQLIICDEIGNEQEASALLEAANCGVPILASAHAAHVKGLLCRPGFWELHRAGVFGLYAGLSRRSGRRDYDYCLTRREEMQDVDQIPGRRGAAGGGGAVVCSPGRGGAAGTAGT